MIRAIRSSLREHWPELAMNGPAPERLAIHLDSRDPREHGFVTFTALRPGDAAPLCAGRIPRDGLATRDALHEYDLLEAIREEAPRVSGRLLPRALFLVEGGGARVATVQSVLPGAPGTRVVRDAGSRPERIEEALRIARRWLGAFTRATGLLEGTEGALWEPFLRSIHFERKSVAEEHHARLDELTAAIDERRGNVTLCGFGHGALSLSCFRVSGDRIGVQNWEQGRSRQAPWADPIHFALDLALREGESPSGAAAALADPETPMGAFVRECLDDTGVGGDVLPLAIPAVALAAAHRVERNGTGEISAASFRDAALAPQLRWSTRSPARPRHRPTQPLSPPSVPERLEPPVRPLS